jgi:hypothetical protein
MRPGRGAGGRPPEPGLSRRSVLRGLGAGALASGAGGVLAACSSGVTSSVGSASGGTISIGFVTPLSGPLAGYASGDSKAVADAIHKVNYSGMCGTLNFAGGPAPGVAIMNPVGVQWKATSGKHPFEMKVVDNSLNKAVKIQASLAPTNP